MAPMVFVTQRKTMLSKFFANVNSHITLYPEFFSKFRDLEKINEGAFSQKSSIVDVCQGPKYTSVLYVSASFSETFMKFSEAATNFIKKETPTKAFSCEFCEHFLKHLFWRTSAKGCFMIFLYYYWVIWKRKDGPRLYCCIKIGDKEIDKVGKKNSVHR